MWRHWGQVLFERRLPSDGALLRRVSGGYQSLDELVVRISRKESPALLFSGEDRDRWLAYLRARYPDEVAATLAKAEEICAHRFDLLGRRFAFDGEINWHLDPDSGRSWPRQDAERFERWGDPDLWIGDSKLVWEINRHQHLVTLGKTLWLTGDARYADECAAQIEGWIAQNPVGQGINWYSALEIGVRLISWGLAFHFFRQEPRFMGRVAASFLKSVYQQTRYLHRHLTLDWEVRNNHIIGEAASLAFIGCLFPEFAESQAWRDDGLRLLERELALQTHADGANKEQASSYHRFVLDFGLLIAVLDHRKALRLSSDARRLMESMLSYQMSITTPVGDLPGLGDGDDGWGYVLAETRSAADALAVGAVLYRRPDFKFVARRFGAGAFWLLGPEGAEAFDALQAAPPATITQAFTDAGHYVLRDSWGEDSDYCLFKCGAFGWGGDGFCAHAHCDLLGFELYMAGRPVLVDSGTYTYHGAARDYFRSTAAHNTLAVDGREQALPRNEFSWVHVPSAECVGWEGCAVEGRMVQEPHLIHRRTMHHPRPGVWQIHDQIEGSGRHELVWYFHLAPDLAVTPSAAGGHLVASGPAGFRLAIVHPPQVRIELESGYASRAYGHKESNTWIRATWRDDITEGWMRFDWRFQYLNGGEVG
jgi:hypothetical protein